MRGVVKRFGSITAVDGLDLEVPAGVCFGLLGPNGAGKSTTMRMLTAQALADAGEISVLGYRLPRQSKQARLQMGVVPQLDNLDVELTCRQILLVFARLYRVPRAERGAAVDRALALANLEPRADTIVRELSGGMRRRLLVARGLIHGPRLVLLDEPMAGMGHDESRRMEALIQRLRLQTTVLLIEHDVDAVFRLADRVSVLVSGQVIASGPPDAVRRDARVIEAYLGEE